MIARGDEHEAIIPVITEIEPSDAAVELREHPVGVAIERLNRATAGKLANEAESFIDSVWLIKKRLALRAGSRIRLAFVAGVGVRDASGELRLPINVARRAVGVELCRVEVSVEVFAGCGRSGRSVLSFPLRACREKERGGGQDGSDSHMF